MEPLTSASSTTSVPSQKTNSNLILGLTCVLLVVAATGIYVYQKQDAPTTKSPELSSTVAPSENGVNPTDSSVQATGTQPAQDKAHEDISGVKPLDQSFPVKTTFEQIDIRAYQRTYPNVHQGWMPSKKEQATEAKNWGNHLGPLGVRIRSHVPQLQGRPAFAANVPPCLRSEDGHLALTAAEVVSVAPGSPADGHLQVGDLIIGIEGEELKSGKLYRPDWDFMHKDARELQLIFGEKIDQAQARGDIRLTVMRYPGKDTTVKQHALPVRAKELWLGAGGNKSIGLQTFDVQVPGDGFLTLVTDQFDNAIHGDGALWLDVTIETADGSVQLLSLPNELARAGYGRAHFTTDKPTEHLGVSYAQSLNLHAHGMAKWRLPKGTRRVKGSFAAISYGKVQPRILYTNLARPLTGVHKDSVIEIRFPIGKTGRFSNTYPKSCPKTELTVTRHTNWLAAQQRPDGTWPRLAGYTTSGWDTAWCGLALMSSGDPKYDGQVKQAAYWIAYNDGPSEWTAERAMRLIFLAEYYLKTKDQAILAGLQSAYVQLTACAKTDLMAGHKVNGFGYGIAGQHYGTGHLALAMAMASRTPISIDQAFVDGIIRHAGEVCVNGTYAYGRGRRMARNDQRRHSGGNAMSGPGILGAIIGGGHELSIQEAMERCSASIGDGDNSHATSSLAFIFASLAMAAGDEDVFLKHMQNFRYKMTLDDNWEGGILKSAFPLDFQGGEGVTSNWIRSAGSILVFNALKKNLTITGKRENFAKERITNQAVSEWGGQVHSYYLRNWCLTKELLGNKAPVGIEEGIAEMEALPRTTALVPETQKIIIKRAPKLIQTISKLKSLTETQRAYAIELLCGLDFKIFTTADGTNQKIDLRITHPLHQLNWLDHDKKKLLGHSDFKLTAELEINGENLTKPILYTANSDKGFNPDTGELKTGLATPLKNASQTQFKGTAKISFTLGSTAVSYTRPLWFNTEFSHSNNINLRRLNLLLKVAPRAYFQSQPLMIAGRPFDCMYPAERMLEVKGPESGTINIHEGDAVRVNLASENFICPWVLSMTFPKMNQVRVATAQGHRTVVGTASGDWAGGYDHDLDTGCELKPSNGKSIIELDFGKPITLNGLDIQFRHGSFIRIWYQNNNRWIPLIWDRYSPHTGHNPRFPDTHAQLWRVELAHGRPTKLGTLRFYHNPNRISPQPVYIQSKEKGSYPNIQPK